MLHGPLGGIKDLHQKKKTIFSTSTQLQEIFVAVSPQQ
jgi:hypothetical protein